MKTKYFPLLFFLLFYGCVKENLTETKYQQSTLDIRDLEYSPFWIQVGNRSNDNSNLNLSSPNIEVIEALFDTLNLRDRKKPFLENLFRQYGIPDWNFSDLCYSLDSTTYILNVPLIKSGEISAILSSFFHPNEFHFLLFSRSKVDSVVENESILIGSPIWELPISRILIYEQEKFGNFLGTFNSLMIERNGIKGQLQNRNYHFEIPWYGYGIDASGTPFQAMSGTYDFTLACGGQDWGLNGDSNGWLYNEYNDPPNNSGDPNDETNDENSPESTEERLLNQLELSDEEEDCLKNYFTPSAQVILLNFLEGQLSNPCDLDQSTQSYISQIINTICTNRENDSSFGSSEINDHSFDNWFVTPDEIVDLINQNDYILLGESFSSNPKVKCVWDNLMESDNEVMCNTLSNFFGGSRFNLNLYILEYQGGDGFTDILENTGNIGITLNSNFVEEACPIEILKTILHESIHAEILRRFKSYSIAELNQIFPDMMSYFNNPNVNDFHHEYIAGEYFNQLVGALQDFYPNEYSVEELEVIVWSGLHGTNLFNQSSGITLSELNNQLSQIRNECTTNCE